MQPYDHHTHLAAVREHMREMQADALRNRQARLVSGPRPLQRRLGQLLITAGEALTRQPLEMAAIEGR
jgi:hypothetical protein